MHKYEELERLYNKKRLKSFVFKLFLLVIVAIGAFFVYKFNFNNVTKKKNNSKISYKINSKKHKKEINTTIIKKKIKIKTKKIVKKKEIKKLNLSPILPTLQEIQKDLNKTKAMVSNTKAIIHKVDLNTTKQKPKIVAKPKIKKPTISVVPKIVIKTENTTLKGLIRVYTQNSSYDLAIRIAKIYYKKEKFKKSIVWVKKANNLNPKDYQSWYLFAENLVKLGKIRDAQKVLIAYLNSYGTNEKIENLLRSIE